MVEREIVFDTETTGLKANAGDRIIEIGAIELINRFPSGKTFHHYINPDGQPIHPDAQKVHGISIEDLAGKPVFADIVEEMLDFFSDAKLIAHNAGFDMGFINAELRRCNLDPIDPDQVIDSLAIARRKFPTSPNSLDALCRRFDIDNSHRQKHGALLDSELLAEVYVELLGGKQASLELDYEAGKEIKTAQKFNGTKFGDENVVPLPGRPRPLANPVTTDDIQSHQAFVDGFGKDAIWNLYKSKD